MHTGEKVGRMAIEDGAHALGIPMKRRFGAKAVGNGSSRAATSRRTRRPTQSVRNWFD
jgi:hypothetical protein